MQRREFLIRLGGVVIAVPAVLELVGCGDDSPASPNNADRYNVPSTGGGHTHTITVLCSDLTAGAGVTYTSTTSAGHFHQVVLMMADVQMIQAGGQVTIITTDQGHTHNWTIRTPSGTC